MENDAGRDSTKASVAMTALKVLVAVVFVAGMTFALVVGYAHFDDGSETPQFEKVEGEEFRFEVVNDWENPGPSDDYNRSEIERLVFEYTNEERAAEGLDELEYTDEFVEIARSHSEDMANNGYVGHVDSQGHDFEERMEFDNGLDGRVCVPAEERERLDELADGGGWSLDSSPNTGENAGATFYETEVNDERTGETVVNENEDDIARMLVNDWMASPAHRENILSEDWNAISVGVYVSEGKTVFATQVFCGVQV
ncbi:MAG: CAP domain-containing protein [Halobacteriales archaeon]|nr:CAP domain-containing protein [Halobacteriales archaeon]